MARALINVPPKAKRGEVIEIKTLISHPMETGYRPKGDGTFFPRDIIQKFVCTLNGEEIFRADLYPGDRRQSVHRLHDGGARGRPADVLVDRRPRRGADGIGEARGRMRCWRSARRCILRLPACWRRRSARAERRRPPLRLRVHEPRVAGDAEGRHRQSRHAVGARRRSAVDRQSRQRQQVLRRLPSGRSNEHEGRGGALSRLQRRAPASARPAGPHQRLPRDASSRRRRSRGKARSCWRLSAYVGKQSRGMPIAPSGRRAA